MVGLLFLVGCQNGLGKEYIAIVKDGKRIDTCRRLLNTSTTFYAFECNINEEYSGGSMIKYKDGDYILLLN